MVGLKLAYIFLLHFLADWAFQSKYMSRNKSNKLSVLLQHAMIHLMVFFFGCMLFMTPANALLFAFLNASVHAVIDWYLWRFYKVSVYYRRHKLIPEEKYKEWGVSCDDMSLKEFWTMIKSKDLDKDTEEMKYLKNEFKYWDDYWFGFMLGFDQMAHAVTIVLIVSFFIL